MAGPTLKSALHYYEQRKDLTEGDRAHLKRWHAETPDPVWDQIAADSKRHGELPPFVEGPYSYFIGSTLRARRAAERAKSPHLERQETEQRYKQECEELLGLADKIEEVVTEVRKPLALFALSEGPPLDLDLDDGPPPPKEPSEAEKSLEWLGRVARKLRERGKKPGSSDLPDLWDDWNCVPVSVSRQSGGKGKRDRSRELRVFMRTMVNVMYWACGKRNYNAVAMMTNIAFEDADLTAEDVRLACKLRKPTRPGKRSSRVGHGS